jgi:hypothetical protein
VNAGHEPGLALIVCIALHEEPASLIIQGGLWEGHNEQAVHHLQHMAQGVLWLPVLFQSVDADLSSWGHIGVEDLGEEEACEDGERKREWRGGEGRERMSGGERCGWVGSTADWRSA